MFVGVRVVFRMLERGMQFVLKRRSWVHFVVVNLLCPVVYASPVAFQLVKLNNRICNANRLLPKRHFIPPFDRTHTSSNSIDKREKHNVEIRDTWRPSRDLTNIKNHNPTFSR